jgi:thioredoxin-related protein
MRFLLCTLLAALGLFLLSGTTSADDYAEALKRAKTEEKPLVLYFFSEACRFCEAMDRDVLRDKEIKASLATDAVFLRIDVDQRPGLAGTYRVYGYPTLWLLEPSGKPIVNVPGYIPKRDFKKIMAFIKGRHYKAMDLGKFLDG